MQGSKGERVKESMRLRLNLCKKKGDGKPETLFYSYPSLVIMNMGWSSKLLYKGRYRSVL